MKNFILTIIGVATLLIALTLNFRHALDDYGVIKNKLHVEVLAQTNDTGGGGTSGGGTSGGGSTNEERPLNCKTYDKSYSFNTAFGTCNGKDYYDYVNVVHIVRACNNGLISFCYPGTITNYYNPCTEIIGTTENTTISICSSYYIP